MTYRFGPIERRGLLGAVRAGQAGLLAAGALLAIVVLDRAPTAGGALAALMLLACAVVLGVAPIGRRTAGEWAPVIAAFALQAIRGATRFTSMAPQRGIVARVQSPARRRLTPAIPDPPRTLGSVRIIEAAYRDRPLGALSEQGGRRLTAMLACRVASFSLLDPEVQERRLARWGLVLAGSAGTPLRRLQWIERTAPAQGDELARWLHAERDPAVPLRGTPMIESYLELIGTTARVTQEHEILLAVQIDSRRVRDRGRDAPKRALVEQTERVAQGLEAAEVQVLGALSSRALARALRTAFDPYCRSELAALETADPDRRGLAEANAWPLGARESWEHYRTDGAVHATYWIGGWPRVDVSPLFMDALLGRSSVVRTIAVTFEPIPPQRSTREVEAAVTRDRADRELRHRFGQSETARQRQAQDATMRREAELADGHGEVRLAGFITVSGRDGDDLRRACSEVGDRAARARLELHRMYGQQADAFTFTLPLCRGLR
ncbi:MAG: type VII secretion protein EccE [Actinomycetota bacterium]|nr:type VII secretion protein EccE [Actinomycetota bacterium]